MRLGEIVSGVVIDPRKLTEYALNPDNAVGGDKALVFERRLGYTKDNYEGLLEQISEPCVGGRSGAKTGRRAWAALSG